MRLSGAQIIVQCLLDHGVDLVFGYPGGQILPFYDALYEYREQIRHILPSHEQGAAHAADGYARSSGRVGVVIATSGPGATNLVTGIATAYMDSVPMLAITGNVPLTQIGTDSFQEVDTTGITMPITKHNILVKDVTDLDGALREAFRIALEGRPGPVLVDVPKDVQVAQTEYENRPVTLPRIGVVPMEGFERSLAQYEAQHAAALDEAAAMLNASQRPMLLVGGGVVRSGASAQVLAFAEALGAPVACTLMGLGAFPASHELYTGNFGMHGTYVSNTASAHCDLFIAVGSRFSDRISGRVNSFLPNAKVLHIDIDRAEINKNVLVYHKLVGDAAVVVELLRRRLLAGVTRNAWREELRAFKEQAQVPEEDPQDGALHPPEMMRLLRDRIGTDAQVATDVGQHQMWVARHMPFEKPGTLITSGGMGTMGYGLGAAIGAQFGQPGRTTVLVTGDGSFRMNCNELATLAYYKLPVVIVLMNNTTLGMVRQWQTLLYDRHYSQTTLERGPDFVALGQSYGISARRVETMRAFDETLQEALASGRPWLVECRIDIDEMVRPMTVPGKAITHFLLR